MAPELPDLDDWLAWKTHCARALCPPDTQRRLATFAGIRFAAYIRRCRHITNLCLSDLAQRVPDDDDAWHAFESHAMLAQSSRGKRYKEWIFARLKRASGNPLDVVQAGASLLLRDAVRKHLCAELPRRQTVSLDEPLPGGDTELTLGDLLPGAADVFDTLAGREADSLADRHAETVFQMLPRPERLGLLARFLGLPISDPKVLRATGMNKSHLCDLTRRVVERIHDALRLHYRHDGADTVRQLTLTVIAHLEHRLYAWRDTERRLPRLFRNQEPPLYVALEPN